MAPKPETRSHPGLLYLIVGAAVLVFIRAFTLLSPILLSFLLILLISLAVNPVISRMRALTGGRTVATGLIVAGFVGVLALMGLTAFGPMRASATQLSEQLPRYWVRLQKPLIKFEQQSILSEAKLQAEVTTEMAAEKQAAGTPRAARRTVDPARPPGTEEPASLRSGLLQLLKKVGDSFTSVAVNAAQILIVLATVFFGVTLTLMNPRPIMGALFSLIPERHHDEALIIMQRIGEFVPRWALATVLGMATIGGLVFLLMWPIFGFADALVLGLIAGVLEAIPYLGPILSSVPALLLAVGKGGLAPLWVVIAYLAVQALENNVTTPLIMARSMQLHPVAVIFSMLLCVAAFGVLGVLVAAPLVAIVGILHDELYRKRFLPSVTDADLGRLARKALHERISDDR